MLADLEKRIKQIKAWGEELIVMIDANEGLQSSRGELTKWIQNVRLADVMVQRHGTEGEPETHINGKERIDFILATPAVTDFIVAAGILDYQEFTQSDHRALYMDLDMAKFLGGEPSPLESGVKRGIMSNDPRAVAVYRTKLENLLNESDLEEETEKLLADIKANDGVLDKKLAREADRLDDKLSAMKHVSERLCRKIQSMPWSPKLREARNKLRYWHMWLTERKTRVDLEEKRQRLDPTGKFREAEKGDAGTAPLQAADKTRATVNDQQESIVVETVCEEESDMESGTIIQEEEAVTPRGEEQAVTTGSASGKNANTAPMPTVKEIQTELRRSRKELKNILGNAKKLRQSKDGGLRRKSY
jgi:hypothetical protein